MHNIRDQREKPNDGKNKKQPQTQHGALMAFVIELFVRSVFQLLDHHRFSCPFPFFGHSPSKDAGRIQLTTVFARNTNAETPKMKRSTSAIARPTRRSNIISLNAFVS